MRRTPEDHINKVGHRKRIDVGYVVGNQNIGSLFRQLFDTGCTGFEQETNERNQDRSNQGQHEVMFARVDLWHLEVFALRFLGHMRMPTQRM